MKIISENTYDLIKDKVSKGSDSYIKWLEKKCLPDNLVDFLVNCSFTSITEIGVVRFQTPETIISEHDKNWPNIIKQGYFLFGSAINGDQWAIGYHDNNMPVFILSHDEIDYDGEKNKKEIIKVAKTLDEFIPSAFIYDKLPWDYWEAKKRINKILF